MKLYFLPIPPRLSRDKLRELGEGFVVLTAEREYKLPANSLNILRTERGKPYFEGDPVYFSLAHSGELLVCALSDAPVGVDIEPIDRAVPPRVAERYLRGELNARSGGYESDRSGGDSGYADIRAWTRYEARGKLLGCGVPIPRELDGVAVEYEEHEHGGYAVSVCVYKK